MANTTISPAAGSATATGVALAMGLALTTPPAEAALDGLATTVAAVDPIAPPYQGCPLSWSALGEGAAGDAIGPLRFAQCRVAVAGEFGAYGALLIQASADGADWLTLAAMADATSPGVPLGESPGLELTPIAGGIVVSLTDQTANPLRYVRPIVTGGDETTALDIVGAISTTGAV